MSLKICDAVCENHSVWLYTLYPKRLIIYSNKPPRTNTR